MFRLKSRRNFSLKFDLQCRTLVYILILLGYGSSRRHMSADADDDYRISTEDQYDYSLPSSDGTSENSEGESSSIETEENGGCRQVRETTSYKYVVVFDILGTICCEQSKYEIQQGLSYVTNHSECPHYQAEENKSLIIFLPHLRILFDYLLSQDVRIVFFPSYPSYRTEITEITEKLLDSFWGSEKYKQLKSQGQFHIHSSDFRSQLKWGSSSEYDTWRNVKDLRYGVIRGKDLSNAILVDSNPLSCAVEEEPFILVRTFYPGTDRDGTRLNSVYYILGLFKTYFENEKYRKLPMRDAFTQILPPYIRLHETLPEWYYRFDHDQPFVQEMINVGLSAVREEVPNATLYKRFGPWWGGDS